MNACPHKQTVSGSGPPKPPGKVSSYSMELGGTLRELQALANTTKHVDMLTLASACLDRNQIMSPTNGLVLRT